LSIPGISTTTLTSLSVAVISDKGSIPPAVNDLPLVSALALDIPLRPNSDLAMLQEVR
jgi:hypothetical protein